MSKPRPNKKEKASSSASAAPQNLKDKINQAANNTQLDALFKQVLTLEELEELIGKGGELLDNTKKKAERDDLAKLVEEARQRKIEISSKAAANAARPKELMFSAVRYNESLKKVLPLNHCDVRGAVRAHFFPTQAIETISQNSGVGIHSDERLGGAVCLILPKSWEAEIDDNIRAYALHCTDTGLDSVNGTKGQSAIAHETVFATQHPGVYLQIVKDALSEMANNRGLNKGEKALLDQSIAIAEAELQNLSNKYFPPKSKDVLFGIPNATRSRTLSGSKEQDGAREVLASDELDRANPPSLDGFKAFMAMKQKAEHNHPANAASSSHLEEEEEKSPTGDVHAKYTRQTSSSGHNTPLLGAQGDQVYDDKPALNK